MTGPVTGPVYLDVQAIQSREYAERGVARHAWEFARAMLSLPPERGGGLVGGLVLNPDLGVPPSLAELGRGGAVCFSDALPPSACRIYHVIAPFELEQPLGRVWPPMAAGMGTALVVTLHDLIPRVFPDHYHADPGLRRRYLAREEVVRASDRVLSVSETTRREAIERLGIDPGRVRVIGAGVSPAFVPAVSPDEAFRRAQARLPRLQRHFLFTVGGPDHRKNLDGLLAAYAGLPAELRASHQLVIACRLSEAQQFRLRSLAHRLGIGPRCLLAGEVDDATLIALYQSTALFVFPSLYEGYGLPVAEAMACGAPVVASGTTATAEVAPSVGWFDPEDPAAIAAAIGAALEDPATAQALAAASARPVPTWAEAAERAAAAYRELLAAPRVATGQRPTLRAAFVTPLPPQGGGVATYDERLLAALAAAIAAHRVAGKRPALEVDVFLDDLEGGILALPNPPSAPPGMALHPVEHFDRVEAARGGYDVLVYAIGNSELHTGALGLARRRPGIVLAHDVSLGQLYAFGAHHGVLAEGFASVLAGMYPDRPDLAAIPDPLLVDPTSFTALPVPMTRELIASSLAFLTTSPHAAALASEGAPAGDAARVGVLVHACRTPAAGDEVREADLVATFGVVNEAKDTGRLIDAFAVVAAGRPGARLVFVGQGSAADLEAVAARAAAAGLAPGVVTATGAVSDEEWDRWLRRATVAVQLRRRGPLDAGEFSGAVAEAVAAGLPLIVAGLGSAGDLPPEAAVTVAPDLLPAELGAVIGGLLADPARRQALGEAGRRFAGTRTFPAVAEDLYARILAVAGFAYPRSAQEVRKSTTPIGSVAVNRSP